MIVAPLLLYTVLGLSRAVGVKEDGDEFDDLEEADDGEDGLLDG